MSSSKQQPSAKQRRDQAAAARAAQQAAEARRDRMIKIIGGVAVLAVVIGIIAVGWIGSRSSDSGNSSNPTGLPSVDPNAALPKGVVNSGDNAYAVPLGTPKAGAPLLQVWEDFQCPACEVLERANGKGIQEQGLSGAAALYYRPTAFLDVNLAAKNEANGTANSSHRAIAAWGCAVDAGKTAEYHNQIYANQPTDEGVGYTQEQLLDFGKKAGITGAAYTTFESCVTSQKYLGWSVNATDQMGQAGVNGTPAVFLAGKQIDNALAADQAKLTAAVAAATTKQ